MKIHQKILTHYLSCTSPVDKEGYLYKKRERNSTYQRRWFVLKSNLLFYQERPANRNLQGVIVLEGCAVHHCESDEQFAFSLVFRGPGLKTYRLAAGDRLTQESWVKALLSANHCYLSLLVRDLGKQYEEAKRDTSLGGPRQSSTLNGPIAKAHTQLMGLLHSSSPFFMYGAGTVVRDSRSCSASLVQASSMTTKIVNKKSPKVWPKRNAHVTPLNVPAPLYGEWPLVGLDPLEGFSKLHEYYGQEVMQLKVEWLKSKQKVEKHTEEDLIDLG
ncbi:sesquipedalian-1 [Aplochiton taeniatus]